MKRAADLAEALYSMPAARNNHQTALSALSAAAAAGGGGGGGSGGPRSPPSLTNNGLNAAGFNTYAGQLAVSVQEAGNGQWTEGYYPSFLNKNNFQNQSGTNKSLMFHTGLDHQKHMITFMSKLIIATGISMDVELLKLWTFWVK